jgi:Ni/Co efflux regulator RcnB
MNATSLFASLSLALALGSPLSQAAPKAEPQHRQNAKQVEHGGKSPSQGKATQAPGKPAKVNQGAAGPVREQRQQPPRDFASVHKAFKERRGQIGRGPSLPPGIHIQQGRPLPKGYGKRLDARALQGLPHYHGYEWRRVGGDMVLIAVATGVVYTILSGVLNN